MKKLFNSQLTNSGGLTLVGFFWVVVTAISAFLLPIFLFVE